MKLYIKILQGDSCFVDVEETTTVLEIKKKIQSDMKIPVSQQSLLLIGKTLVDDKPVSFYPTIKDGTKLNLVIKKPEPLNIVMMRFLQRYYSEAQAKSICDEFIKDLERRISNASLDDLERIAKSYLNEDNS